MDVLATILGSSNMVLKPRKNDVIDGSGHYGTFSTLWAIALLFDSRYCLSRTPLLLLPVKLVYQKDFGIVNSLEMIIISEGWFGFGIGRSEGFSYLKRPSSTA